MEGSTFGCAMVFVLVILAIETWLIMWAAGVGWWAVAIVLFVSSMVSVVVRGLSS